MVGQRFLNATAEALTTRYFHTDHLGSISAITDENGNVAERLSYDAWASAALPMASTIRRTPSPARWTRKFPVPE